MKRMYLATASVINRLPVLFFVISLLFSSQSKAQCYYWGAAGSGISSGNVTGGDITNMAGAVDGSTPYICFRDSLNANKLTVKKYNGSAWVTVGSAGFSAGTYRYAAMAVDGAGTPYVAYSDIANGYKTTVMKYNGSSWVAVGAAGFTATGANATTIAIGPGNVPYIAYSRWTDYKTVVMKYNGSSWDVVGTAGFSSTVAGNTQLAFDGSGIPYVAYLDGDLKGNVMKYDGSSWVAVGSLAFTPASTWAMSFAVTSSGTPYVAYRDPTIYYAATVKKYDGSAWVVVGSEGMASYGWSISELSLTIDNTGTPYLAFSMPSYGGVSKLDGSSWVQVGNANIFGPEIWDVSVYDIHLISGSAGDKFLIYADGFNGKKAAVKKLTAFSSTISGTASVCTGAATTLSHSQSGGVWKAVETDIATVGSATGAVTAVKGGTATISYTLLSCAATKVVTVSPNPGHITGLLDVSVGGTITLSNATAGGTWSVSNANASITSGGVVTGVAVGTTTVSYTASSSCGPGSDIRVITILPTGPYSCGGWQTIGPSTGLSGDWVNSAALKVANDGTPYYVFGDASEDYKLVVKKFTGSSWVNVGPSSLEGTYGSDATIDISKDGYVYVASQSGSYGLMVKKYDGNSWVTLGEVVTLSSSASPYLKLDTAGIPYIFYADDVNGYKGTVRKYNGSAWELVGVAGFTDTALSWGVSIDIDETTNTPYVAYQDNANSSKITVKTFNGSSWVSVGSEGFAGSGAELPVHMRVALDKNGVPYIFFNDNDNDHRPVVMKFNGSTWVNVGNLETTGGAMQLSAAYYSFSMAFDSGNAPVVVYSDEYSGNRPYVKRFDGSGWSIVGEGATTTNVAYGNTLAIDNSNNMYVVSTEEAIGNKPVAKKLVPVSSAITGTASLCVGASVTLSNTTPGGYWNSDITSIVTVGSATGIVTGNTGGIVTVKYTLGSCSATKVVTVNPAAGKITGPMSVVAGSTGTFSNVIGGGSWSVSNSNASINSTTGVLTGVSEGTATVSYSVTGSCGIAVDTVVVTIGPAASVGPCAAWHNIGNTEFTDDYSYYGDLAIDTFGRQYLVYGDVSLGEKVAVKRFNGSSWATLGTPGLNVGNLDGVSIAVSNAGTPYISYTDLDWYGIEPGKFTVKKFDGSDWVSLSSGLPDYQTFGRVYTAPSGEPYILISNPRWGLQVRKYNGSAWETVGGGDFGEGSGGDLAFASDGTPYVVFADRAAAFKISVKKFNGSSWVYVGSAGISAGLSSHSRRITVGGSGNVYIIYDDYSLGNKAVVRKYNGSSWSVLGTAGFSLGSIQYPEIFADNTDNVYVSFADGGFGYAAYVGKYNGSSWVDLTPASMIAYSGINTSFALDKNGIPHLAYNDAGGSGKYSVMQYSSTASVGAITGSSSVCVSSSITVSSATTGGTWSSGDVAVATVGSADGIVTGISNGTAVITYTVGACNVTKIVTVGTSGGAGTISGTATVCTSATITLSNLTTGGTWTSGNTSVATIGSSNGVVSGAAAGTSTITYTVASGCGTATTTQVVTVNGTPSAGTITGTAIVCESATTTLSNAVTGGVWTSGNTSVATIGSSSGIVTGVTNGNATITYTVTNSCGSNTATKVVTVNSAPSVGAITGTLSVCTSSTTTLNNATTGGVWTSGSTSIATIGSSTGVVSGIASGNANITYTVTGSCGTASTTATVTVNASPSSIGSITGTLSFCAGATSTLGNSASGGTWVSSNTSVATVGSSNGVVSGVAGGNATITYILTNECGSATTTAAVTVNGTPSVSGITGTLSVCMGASTSLNNATGGGVWSSSNTAKGTVSGAGVVSGISAGTTTISYTVSNSCGSNAATAIVTVNPAPNAGSITGSSSVSTGSTITLANAATGGAWSSSNSNATVNSSGVVTGVTVGTATISYTVTNSCGTAVAIKVITINSSLSGITGSMAICVGGTTTLSIAETGGTWSSSNTLFATVGSSSGIVTGITPGTVTISYTLDGGTVTAVVTVNGNPAITSGSLSACPGNTITLSGAPSGGVWSSSTPGVATVSGGVVTGASSGTSTISYTNASGCAASVVVTINSSPASISGSPILCVGSTVTYTNSTGGGTWSGSSTSVIDGPGGTGAVTGMSAGTAIITYNTAGGCKSVLTITVNGIPANITGTLKACPGTSTTLGSSTSGGTWSSASTGIATIGSSSGIVTGVLAGTAVISYSLGTGCAKTAVVTINANPSASVAGSTTICIGLNTTMSNSTPGMVSWTSSNTSVATVLSTGVVNGVAAGTAHITYTVGSGCYTTTQITVNAKPTINGATSVCPGSIITLTSPTSGGTWSSSNTSAATIGSSTGALTGVSAGGSTVITYSLGASCYQVRSEAVSTLPLAIGGYAIACEGTTTTLTHSNAGTWSSGDASVASVGTPTVGIVTGVNAGTTNITFTLNSTGCTTTKVVTVNTVPPAITGTGLVCVGLQTTLANAQTGGSWSSSNTYYANVGSATGIVTASTSAGTATISYSYGTNCKVTTVVTVRAVPAAILGPSSVCIGSTVTFSNSTGNGTWSSSNPSAATVAPGASSYYGAVTGAGAGVTTLTYTNAPSCTRTQTVTVAACRGVNTTGIENTENNVAVSLFPNPTTGSFTVSAHVNGTLSVYTLEGREVSKHEINKGETQISLSNELSRGIYMCRFNGEDGSAVMVRLVVE